MQRNKIGKEGAEKKKNNTLALMPPQRPFYLEAVYSSS